MCAHCCRELSSRTSVLSLTNSLATSSVVRWDRILRIVQPVSSIWTRRPSVSQQAHEPWDKICQIELQSFVQTGNQGEFYFHFFNLIDDILKLHHRHANQPVVTAKAVVLDGYVKLIGSHLLLITNVAAIRKRLAAGNLKLLYVQEESFVKLRRPAFVLFGCKFSFLVRQVRSDQVDLNIRLQPLLRLCHLQVISRNNWRR